LIIKKGIMNRNVVVLLTFFILYGLVGCSKRTHPETASTTNTTGPAATKPIKRATIKKEVPKVITVNDKAAKKSLDGRYYYDLEGHRYWRNNRDGKYYLFNQSMFDNPDFKVPGG
jgi:phosphate-selective porin